MVTLFVVLSWPDAQKEERPRKMHRRNSDSYLYCKALYNEEAKVRTIKLEKPDVSQVRHPRQHLDDHEGERSRYLDQERLAFVQNYLENTEDSRSMTTETSDSGMPGAHGTPSEFGIEEINGE